MTNLTRRLVLPILRLAESHLTPRRFRPILGRIERLAGQLTSGCRQGDRA
jgi:hypothetical protein